MNVKILKVATQELVRAIIRKGKVEEMPSIQQNWRFNFNRHFNLPNATAYIIVTEETPKVVEGCLIFQMKEKKIPYMAYVEVAPHNQGDKKKYIYVGGCLIAFAYKQSLINGQGDYRGMLFFDVKESNEEEQIKLMGMYSQKYNAKVVNGTTMVIMDEGGDALIEEYLNR
jgi:hypothetical protein